MTDEEEHKESAVEVTLPDEDTKITEISLDQPKAEVKEEQPVIEPKREPRKEPEHEPVQEVVDERERMLQDMRRQYERQRKVAEAEREARKRAEQFAQEQAQQVQYAKSDIGQSNLRLIVNAIESTEAAAAGLERDYADALAAQDFTTAAKIQRSISDAAAQLLQLQNGRAKLEEQLQAPTEGRVEAPKLPTFEPQLPPDPVEQYAERLTPKSAAWLRAHPEAVDKIGKLTRAHADAVEDGIVPESDEYFAFVESRLGISRQPMEEAPKQSAPRQPSAPPKKSVVSAPVSSSASGISSRPSNANTMTLTPSEVEFALLAEPDMPRDKAIESYARNKAYLIKTGKLSA